jgi:hypothetical protein
MVPRQALGPLCDDRLLCPPDDRHRNPDKRAEGIAPFLGAIACGLGIGAEIDLMTFFTSRYFGLRD